MTTWIGGPCPDCGDDMPPAMIHCRNCRKLLNTDLEWDSVEVAIFIPLEELDSMIEIVPTGVFVDCPKCVQELKINRKYFGERVECKFCGTDFRLDPTNPHVKESSVYSKCPHCERDLRFARKYVGVKVACRFCGGKIHIVDEQSIDQKTAKK